MLENFLENVETCYLADEEKFMLVSNPDEEEDPDDELKDGGDIDKGGKTDA